MQNELSEVINYARLSGGEIANTYSGFDGDFNEEDKANLPQDKYVLPYIFFTLNDKPKEKDRNKWSEWLMKNDKYFNHLGELTIKFNQNSKKDGDSIYWKLLVWNGEKENGVLCFSPTTNRMDLYDPSVVLGLTKVKRMELLATSLELFKDFGEYLKNEFNS